MDLYPSSSKILPQTHESKKASAKQHETRRRFESLRDKLTAYFAAGELSVVNVGVCLPCE